MKNDFLKYYGEKNISPVKQDISDLQLHCRRREKLYRQLGLPFCLFRDKNVLEIGPGSGYNTLVLLQRGGVEKIDLVEPNQKGISDMLSLFCQYGIDKSRYEIFPIQIEEFHPESQYEIILAEGFLHSIDNAPEIIDKLLYMLASGGVLVITCMDELSVFVEQIKRLVAHVYIMDIRSYEEQVDKLTSFFTEQMSNLKGMSRSVEDWVRDDLLNPAFQSSNLLSIGKVIELLPDNINILGTSQNMFTDYSWYKDVQFDIKGEYLSQFKKKQHNLILTGGDETIISIELNTKINEIVKRIREAAKRYEKNWNWEEITEVVECLNELEPIVGNVNERLFCFVKDSRNILLHINEHDFDIKKYSAFFHAVGRTQQYISLVKNRF